MGYREEAPIHHRLPYPCCFSLPTASFVGAASFVFIRDSEYSHFMVLLHFYGIQLELNGCIMLYSYRSLQCCCSNGLLIGVAL